MKIKTWQIIVVIISIIFGTLLHYTYELSGENIIVGLFFYTYTGIIGKNIDWLNIATFIIAVILGQYIAYRLLTSRKNYNAELVAIFFLIILFLSFILYTFNPPKIGLFKDPITSGYGINR